MQSLSAIQSFMRDERIAGWLGYDFRGSNPILAQLLPGRRVTTRRAMLYIPARGTPELLAHGIDFSQFAHVDVPTTRYATWTDWRDWLAAKVALGARIAMEYAPGGGLPVVSIADAGTVELVRSFGAEVVSSADLIQVSIAVWSEAAEREHTLACTQVGQVKDDAFGLIRTRLAAGRRVTEHEVQQFMMGRFAELGLETPDAPIVAVNAHAGDPHFEVSATSPAEIKPGDWILIDLWARRPGDENIFCDITWTGYAGRDVPARMREVYEAVRNARDACLARAQQAWQASVIRARSASEGTAPEPPIQGWQLDDAARAVLIAAGLGDYIRHRTGHSLSPGPKVHGLGMNLDNMETRDTRAMLPGIGFTIEPGAYLPDFGVRSEIDVFSGSASAPGASSSAIPSIVLV